MGDDGAARNTVVIERVIEAPVDLVWRMWTEPEHFAAWYGPNGATVPVATMDVRVGGTRLVCMERQTPNGTARMWFAGEYREVVEKTRLVYTESISDEHGNVLPPAEVGLPAGHPATTEVRVEFADMGGRCRMVVTHVGVADDSPGAAAWRAALDTLAIQVARHAGP